MRVKSLLAGFLPVLLILGTSEATYTLSEEEEDHRPEPSKDFKSYAAKVMKYHENDDGTVYWKGHKDGVAKPTDDDMRLHRNEAYTHMRSENAMKQWKGQGDPSVAAAHWYPSKESEDVGSLVFTTSGRTLERRTGCMQIAQKWRISGVLKETLKAPSFR
ncbi:unnamed protein product [Clonostachys rosea]|uniref:SCP domain-containing protein n=1 Tax=Bionectria ochroleuca TaxID=29856 RepID=A0ABY6UL60_BIOOC|nr:unnamed protein product [Clonostachys rosea]